VFTIRKQQLQVFSEQAKNRFQQRLLEHVREHFADEIERLGEEDLRKKVLACMEAARAHGIQSEQGVALYTDACMAIVAEEPMAVPGARNVLEDDDLDGNTKASLFCDMIILYMDAQYEKQQ